MKLALGFKSFSLRGLGIYLALIFLALPMVSQRVYAEAAVQGGVLESAAAEIPKASSGDNSSLDFDVYNVKDTANTHKSTSADPKKISSSSQLASLLGGLILIVGLIYGLSWFVKRFSQGGFAQNATIKMLATMPLGTRERIMLVDVGGKHILLGVTATQISSLHVFDEPVTSSIEKVNPTSSDFSQKLMTLLQKNMSQKNMSQQDVMDPNEIMQEKDADNSAFKNHKNIKK